MLQFDIATKFISENSSIYILHPGAAKKFYKTFREESAVFLDIPGADLSGDIKKKSKALLNEVKKIKKIHKWYSDGGAAHQRPSTSASAYKDVPTNRGHAQLAGNIIRLYSDIKKGDLLVCPGHGYMTPILMGEVLEDFSPEDQLDVEQYNRDKVPFRKVNWLNSSVLKAHVSNSLRSLTQNRRAIISVNDDAVAQEIYSYAYESFVLPSDASSYLYVRKLHTNLFSVGKGIDIIEFFAAMYEAQSLGELEEFLELADSEAVEKYLPNSFMEIDAGISINSPGHIFLKRAKAKSLPLYISVMLAATAVDANLDSVRAANLVNSTSTVKDECHLDVEGRVLESLRMIGYERWQKLCMKRQQSIEYLGLDSPVVVVDEPDESGGEGQEDD